MGFNNEGVEALVERLKKGKPKNLIVGGNIGKNKVTPNENAADDYIYAFEQLFPFVDYFVVNVSSPNTPNLRDLQEKEPLTKLLSLLQALNQQKVKPKPILLKIAPDLTDTQLDDIIEIVAETKIEGVIATNTTIMSERGTGGISGKLLYDRARSFRKECLIKMSSVPELEFIGVGGFSSYDDIVEYWKDGGRCLQLYSAFIYQGPNLLKNVNKCILEDMEFKGLSNVSELISYYQKKISWSQTSR